MERLRLPGIQVVGRQFTRELLTMDGHRPVPKNYTFTFTKPNNRTQERSTVQCGDFLDQAAKVDGLQFTSLYDHICIILLNNIVGSGYIMCSYPESSTAATFI
jgi:hypothetical protein